ncbi:GAF domain-containing hybrid sensor histidine kinase/response regulator [Mesoterricola silvestris]|uniref:GAF domain-containing hybrid sensor histidine kinase/response regulator n=1 Tax=Mesoterricola silvestris TaxID=2927979 RepID=UPI002931CEBF|nr:ATP-binding protein [Mesoterricola silvestris]
MWRSTFDAVPDLLAVLDENRNLLQVNKALLNRLGPGGEALLGRPCHEVFHRSGQPVENCPLHATQVDGQPHDAEVRVEGLGGDYQVRTSPIFDAQGRLRGTVHLARDISDRRLRERGMQQLNRVVQALSRSSQAMARAQDEAGYLGEVCRIVVEDCGCFLAWIGYKMHDPAQSIRPMAWAGFEDGYLSTLNLTWADTERGRGPTGLAMRSGRPHLCRNMDTDPDFEPWRQEARARGYASSLALPLMDGAEVFGVLTVYSAESEAFTEAQVRVLGELADDLAHGILNLRLRESERRAQEALRESTEDLKRLNDELELRVQERTADLVRANEALTARILDRDRALEALRESEERLRHAQKMEAIGTLAGGVAHDFNNLLQVINGYAEMALERLILDHPLRIHLETIQRAGLKGAALTRQLLAFSRKQVLAPEILDLNILFREMETFFQRVVKEDIRLVFDLDPGMGPVKADHGQLEQVIMNLVVNARDAMPKGGTLTLRTGRREGFATFSVADTGEGMTPQVLGRIFEPFYTTKAVGKGTGLGLSTALGIVEQSGGFLEVASAPGLGTTFTVSLPLATELAAKAELVPEPEPGTGTETILLVEDDESVLQLTAHHLRAAGYRVLEAADPAVALELLHVFGDPVHLLLTDVVMPGMGGRELAQAVKCLRPGIRVVFMSGYPDALVGPDEVWTESILISKPFDRAKLLSMVRNALD